ncbi:MAG TPA: hypothetical protein VFQ84_04015 [Arenimonas sp.]|uniref:hypothetical protein n=1 Tax=Arenimonas sp. TaxID=1872635 RepID=UPI002D807A4E|nr:hypothetical protein [Arenimonas sp.]HEU0152494.1 hypothetical protein [Arenimonas sp.]
MRHYLLMGLLLLSAFGAAGEARAFGRCDDGAYMRGFDNRLGPTSCRTVHTSLIVWHGGTADLRVILPGASLPVVDEGVFRERIDELVRRVGPAMNQMGGRLALGEVSILLSNLEFRGYHAVTRTRAGECQITFFKDGRDISVDQFLFTLSHELFHCIQYDTWESANGDDPALWWMEGTAEYFAHLANRNSAEADSILLQYDQDSPDVPLLDMNYPAQVFFLWLGGSRGSEAIPPFIAGMASAPGRAAQLEAMRERIPMDTWMAFAQDYIDGRIRLPGGRELPGGVDFGRTTVIDGPRTVAFDTSEYVLTRQQLLFKKGRTYTLAQLGGVGDYRSRFDESLGEWIDPPERVLACDEDRVHTVLSLATEGENVTYSIQVEESARIDERACCLVGRWQPTEAARRSEPDMALANTQAILASHGVDMQCGVGDGGWTLVFTEDGTGHVDWEGFAYQCFAREGGNAFGNVFTREGSTVFDWTVVERGVGRADYTDNSLAWTHDTHFGPQVMTRVLPDAGPSTPANNFSFTCSDTSLSIQGIYGLNHQQGEYTRLGTRP